MDKFWKNAQVYGRNSKNWQARKAPKSNRKAYEIIPMGKLFSGDIHDVCGQIKALVKHECTVEVILSDYNKFYERQDHLVKITIPKENRTVFYELHYMNYKWIFNRVKND